MNSGSRTLLTAALLRQEVFMHLLGRIGARLWILVSPLGWADTPALRALLCAFMAYDVLLAILLRRPDPPSLPIRWVLDVLDVTLWAMLCPATAPYTAAVFVALPLVVVTVVRRGILAGALVGTGVALVPAAGRVMVGKLPFLEDSAFFISMAVVLGYVMVRVLVAEVTRQQAESVTSAEADLLGASLAGRNDVIVGVGGTIDELQTTIMQLTAVGVDAATKLRAMVADHKWSLAQETRKGAMYLRDALDAYAWQARASEPAVARHVFFDVPGEAGVLVLTKDQSERFAATLAVIKPTGVVPVRAVQMGAGDAVRVEVGTETIFLPASASARVRLGLVPAAITGLALYVLSLSDSAYTAVPWRLTIPLALMVVGYAVATFLVLLRRGVRLEPWFAVGALVPFGLVALLTVHAAHVTGPARVTLLGPLAGLALLLGTVTRPRAAVILAWSGLVAAGVAVVWSSPGVSNRYVSAELIWPLIAFLAAQFLTRTVAQLGNDLVETFSAERRSEMAQVRRAAAHREVNFLLDVLAEGESLCRSAEPGPLTVRVIAHLAELRQDLQTQFANTS